jgi:hypothetical protein
VFKSPLGHNNRCDFPKPSTDRTHAPGHRSSWPAGPPAPQPAPVRGAAMTARPVARVIPVASPGRRQGNSGARRTIPLSVAPSELPRSAPGLTLPTLGH